MEAREIEDEITLIKQFGLTIIDTKKEQHPGWWNFIIHPGLVSEEGNWEIHYIKSIWRQTIFIGTSGKDEEIYMRPFRFIGRIQCCIVRNMNGGTRKERPNGLQLTSFQPKLNADIKDNCQESKEEKYVVHVLFVS